MLPILDRYILRETLRMVFLTLLVFTFVLMIDPLMRVVQALITKGVDVWTIVQLMLTLVPQGLGVTIPMAVLIGLLMGLGRLSGDRETVALQACGISIYQMLRPVAVLGTVAMAATTYTLVVAVPDANQAFREITFRTLATRAEDEVKPRVFYQGFPGVVLYVRDVDTQGTGWSEVFLADNRDPENPQVYIADKGRVIIDRENRVVDIVLTSGSGHRVDPEDPATYDVHRFDESLIKLDPDTIFPPGGPARGLREMTIPELQAQAASMREQGVSPHNEIIEIHQKFSLPVACLVFAIIGLALGVTSRKDGKLASFALGIGVIFAYYIIMYSARALAKGDLVSPHLAMWLPNIILGGGGVALLVWRARSTERRVPLGLSVLGRRSAAPLPADTPRHGTRASAMADPGIGVRAGAGWSGGGLLSLLDRYVGKQYLKIVLLTFVGLLGIFYIATFVDLADKLFKGTTTVLTILEYFWYATPQFIFYVLPISALVATLVTVGMLTKSSELTVMKACGISLYRVSLPLLLFAVLWSGVLFGMGESFLADANRRAEAIRHVINGNPAETFDLLDRRWLVSPDGRMIYHYVHFDPDRVELNAVTTYRFADDDWQLAERTYATQAVFDHVWQGREVWIRQFGDDRGPGAFERSEHSDMSWIDPPEYFTTEQPEAERMSYRELTRYIRELEASGVDVVALRVALQRKLSFPFVTLILTLIAVPFAVTTGRHGAMYGVGIGIVLAFSYWLVAGIFAAIGSAGLLTPLLAAWAPNVLFGGSAVYMLLAVRT
ncbi:MAG: LPS export ABC transporter permease LptG [Acidobacteria bacterium]|nr:LPS export ABC transporter permease LptG [Acidobacteriota bacterium]